jgi:pyruvate dehydrogenase E1 component alpha subunit
MKSIIFFLEALESVIKIRTIENCISNEFKKNQILSFLHLSIGQEACAVGVAMASKKQDNFFGNHRSHGHYLAKKGNLKKMIYEVFGDKRGCCKGIGGSMHMLDKTVNFLGSIPILGSSLPIASGIAHAEKLSKKKNITVVFIGDGSAEEGSFYETINMAGLYKLPLLVVIEDNKYAVESDHIKRKVRGYNLENITKKGLNTFYERIDGQDFCKVYLATKKMREKIMSTNKVGILHLDCLRFSKHSGPEISEKDQRSKYRKAKEYLKILKHDPINIIEKYILKMGFEKKKLMEKKKLFYEKYRSQFYNIFQKINIKKV